LISSKHLVAEAESLQKRTTQSNTALLQTQNQLNEDISSLRIESGKLQGEITQLRIQHKKLVDSIAEIESTMAAKRNSGSAPATSKK